MLSASHVESGLFLFILFFFRKLSQLISRFFWQSFTVIHHTDDILECRFRYFQVIQFNDGELEVDFVFTACLKLVHKVGFCNERAGGTDHIGVIEGFKCLIGAVDAACGHHWNSSFDMLVDDFIDEPPFIRPFSTHFVLINVSAPAGDSEIVDIGNFFRTVNKFKKFINGLADFTAACFFRCASETEDEIFRRFFFDDITH